MQPISKTLKIFFSTLILINFVLTACLAYFFLNSKHNLTAERIDINDVTGKNRIVIANTDNIPQPIINGKTYKRAKCSTKTENLIGNNKPYL